MPDPKPTFDKINDMLIVDAIDEILKDLLRAVDSNKECNTKEMIGAIEKLRALREIHLPKRTKSTSLW